MHVNLSMLIWIYQLATCVYACIEIWTYEHIFHACLCLYIHAQIGMYVYALCMHMNMLTINTSQCACVCVYMHESAHACICMHANVYAHTFKGMVPTYIHMYMCTYFQICWLCTCMCRIDTNGSENVWLHMWVHLNISTACVCVVCAYVFVCVYGHTMLM